MQRARGGRVSALRRAIGLCALAALVAVPAAGTRIYQTHVDYSTGQLSIPAAVAIADLNADNKPDLVTANQYGSASVLLGNGDGTFGTHHEYAASGHSESNVVVADLNGDNKPDLVLSNPVVVSGQSSVSVLLGAGDGTFPTHTDYATPPFATDVAVGDLNEDGKPDIVTVNNEGNDISVFLGNGDGTFQAAANHGTGSSPWSLGIADFNGDGHLDVFVVGSPDSTVLFGAGDGTFSSTSDLQFEGGDWMTVADLNGDGSPDVASVSSNTARVLLNNTHGSFSFTQLPTLPFLAYTVTAADLNGDGHQDLLMADNGSSNIWVLYGDGDGSFQSPFSLTAGSNPLGIAVAPLNGDALPDIAVSNTGSLNVSVILQHLSSDANLTSLGISDGTLSPSFDTGTASYTDTVPYDTATVTVTPAVEDPTASVQVRVDGGAYAPVTSGAASDPLSLDVGDNPVDVLVTAEDGSTQTYTITVTRQAQSSDAKLSSLTLSAGPMTPSFSPDITGYNVLELSSTESITMTPTVEESHATIEVSDNGGPPAPVTSGQATDDLPLAYGINTIDLVVTAQDGSTIDYSFAVKRLRPYECGAGYPCWSQFTVDGTDPPPGLELQTFAQDGEIRVQLQADGGSELSDYLTSSSDVHVEVQLASYDPVVFSATGNVRSYSETTQPGTNSFEADLSPLPSSSSPSCHLGDCATVTATQDYDELLLGSVSDLNGTSDDLKDELRGTWISSNAQTIGAPAFDPDLGTLSVQLAAPQFASDGSPSQGLLKFFLPSALVEAMGFTNPLELASSDLTVTGSSSGAGGANVSPRSSPDGILVQPSGVLDLSQTFTIAAAVDSFFVTTDASATAGAPLSLALQALNSQGNEVPSYTGTVHFSGGGAGAVLPADYTFTADDAGGHFFSGLHLKEAGTQTVTVTDTGDSSLTATTDPIDVSPAAADHLVFLTGASPIAFGGTRELAVEVRDAFGNLEDGDDATVVSFDQASGDGSVSGLHDATASGGTATETVTGSGGGDLVIEATASGLASDSTELDVLAKNGSGSMTASPTKVKHGATTLVTLTYVAPAGGMVNGTLTVAVPAGWTTPTASPNRVGYPIASAGTVAVSGRVITISNITRAAGQKVTILYDRKGAVTAPARASGAQTWVVTQRSQSTGTLKRLAKSPVISVG